MCVCDWGIKALKADDSIFGLPRPPQIHVHFFRAHTLHQVLCTHSSMQKGSLAVSRRYPRNRCGGMSRNFEKCHHRRHKSFSLETNVENYENIYTEERLKNIRFQQRIIILTSLFILQFKQYK